jgi:hypothetical protein
VGGPGLISENQNPAPGGKIIATVNHFPVAADDFGYAPGLTISLPRITIFIAFRSISGNVLTNDSGLQDTPLTVTVIQKPRRGTATIDDSGAYTYKPMAGGSDSFVYRVCDADGDCATATVHTTVG